MHTKYRNKKQLINLAKHWALNINRDPNAFINFYIDNCNYENLVSQKEIIQETNRIYISVPKTEYGCNEIYPCFQVGIEVESGGKRSISIKLYGQTLKEITCQINLFKKDYKNSFFKVTKIIVLWYHEKHLWDHPNREESINIKNVFSDMLKVETTRFISEEKRLKSLDRKDKIIQYLDRYSIKYAFIQKLLLCSYAFGAIYNGRNRDFFVMTVFVALFLICFKNHSRQVDKDKLMEFKKDVARLQ